MASPFLRMEESFGRGVANGSLHCYDEIGIQCNHGVHAFNLGIDGVYLVEVVPSRGSRKGFCGCCCDLRRGHNSGLTNVLIYAETPLALVETSQFARDPCFVLLSNSSSLNVVEVQLVLSSFYGHVQVVVEAQHVVFVDIEVCVNQVDMVPQMSIDTQHGSNVGGLVHIVSD